ncbi:MAG: UDP-3-O-(3-hydroxymyristoyl)glucosamine N-acyltransferase [Bacteroidota bacterium]|nr:UDP-3-O-(3-hydroxymyristoyl)glucosamine N-acyltransferase [Bacteroidota bacterium]
MDLKESISVAELGLWFGRKHVGDESLMVTGINEIHNVRSGDITFVDAPKYYSKVLQSDATVIIINQDIEAPTGKALIISDNPFADYNRLVNRYLAAETPNSNSDVHFEDVTIYPNVYIGHSVSIGKGSIIHPNVVIYDYTTIGENVEIHSNTTIGSHAYYYKNTESGFEKMISCGSVIIEDNVEIGAGCCIDKGVSSATIIGQGTKIDNHVQIGHDVTIGTRCLIGSQVGIAGTTKIGNNVILWGQVGVTKDITIGDGVVVSAQSGVSKDLSGEGVIFSGSPARPLTEARKEMAWVRMKMKEF